MNRLFATAAAAAFTAILACGTSAQADDKADKAKGNNKANQTTAKVNHQNHGKGKARAIFHLRDFRGFTSYCYMARYRCYAYFSPADAQWFYWYQPAGRFVPIAYLTQYPPVAGAGPVAPLPGTTGTPPAGGLPPGGLPPGGTTTLPPLPGQTEPAPTGDPLPLPPQ